jgi:hypothetical protein
VGGLRRAVARHLQRHLHLGYARLSRATYDRVYRTDVGRRRTDAAPDFSHVDWVAVTIARASTDDVFKLSFATDRQSTARPTRRQQVRDRLESIRRVATDLFGPMDFTVAVSPW